jgi:hypothetical protein
LIEMEERQILTGQGQAPYGAVGIDVQLCAPGANQGNTLVAQGEDQCAVAIHRAAI